MSSNNLIPKTHSTSSWDVVDTVEAPTAGGAVAPSPTWLMVDEDGHTLPVVGSQQSFDSGKDSATQFSHPLHQEDSPLSNNHNNTIPPQQQPATPHTPQSPQRNEEQGKESDAEANKRGYSHLMAGSPPQQQLLYMQQQQQMGMPYVSSVDSLFAAGTFAHYSPTVRDGYSFRPVTQQQLQSPTTVVDTHTKKEKQQQQSEAAALQPPVPFSLKVATEGKDVDEESQSESDQQLERDAEAGETQAKKNPIVFSDKNTTTAESHLPVPFHSASTMIMPPNTVSYDIASSLVLNQSKLASTSTTTAPDLHQKTYSASTAQCRYEKGSFLLRRGVLWDWQRDPDGTMLRCTAAMIALTAAQATGTWLHPSTVPWLSLLCVCSAATLRQEWAEEVPRVLGEAYYRFPLLWWCDEPPTTSSCVDSEKEEEDKTQEEIGEWEDEENKNFILTSSDVSQARKLLMSVEIVLAACLLVPLGYWAAVVQSDAAAVALAVSALWAGPAQLLMSK